MTGLFVGGHGNPGRGTIFSHYPDVKGSLQKMQDWLVKMQNSGLKLQKCALKVQDMLKSATTSR